MRREPDRPLLRSTPALRPRSVGRDEHFEQSCGDYAVHQKCHPFGQRLSLRIAQEDLAHFASFDLDRLSGHELEARGYVHRYRGRSQIRVRHPADLRIAD